MAIALFICPMIGAGTRDDPHRPQYTDTPGIVSWDMNDYSPISVALVCIDAPQAILDAIEANPGVTLLATPANIDTPITTGQRNALRSILEGVFVPGTIAATGETRRVVLRRLKGIIYFSQRMNGRFGTAWKERAQNAGITLDTQWLDLPQAVKDEFLSIRDQFPRLRNLGLTNTSTIREIFRAVGDAFANIEMPHGTVVI